MSGSMLSRREAGLGLFGAMALSGVAFSGAAQAAGSQKLFFLGSTKVLTVGVDGAGVHAVVDDRRGGGLNDGIAYDPVGKHVYWTNMGKANLDDGFLMRANLDGGDVTPIVPPGGTFTPKQMKIDVVGRKLYWSDREGMRIQRCNMDGSKIETLIETGHGDGDRKNQSLWCVGIAIDVAGGHVYWTQKGSDDGGQGSIRRMGINIPKGQKPANRKDIEVLFLNLPEPIDLDLDLDKRLIYWTDRGDNTVNRAPMAVPPKNDPAARTDRQILVRGLKEAIGVTLDLPNKRMFYTSLGGEVGTAGTDGSGAKLLLTNQGTLTGIVLVDA
jgi:DNA-binding beta-propeller fold protein YncE